MNPLKAFFSTLSVTDTRIQKAKASIYDIQINNLQGQLIDFTDFKNKHILVVNVASKCGFTPQYKQLQELQDTYKENLVVIGVPCNQFGSQEPGDPNAIEEFCQINYGVTFLITEKIDVKGNAQHPLYSWLTKKTINGNKNSTVKWNFQKYLIDENGEFLDYYFSTTKPTSSKITSYLK